MNERVMQFRIGLFVIFAGLSLTMMIVWFGESPALLRGQSYVTVLFQEAPGVNVGIPVRKSGIRVGEVVEIEFTPAGSPDGVLVTLAMDTDRREQIKEGSIPRITRALIGDVSIDLAPGTGSNPLPMFDSPSRSKRAPIQGEVSPDPSKALEAATKAFEQVGPTLENISNAAQGLGSLTKKAEKLDEFLAAASDAGNRISRLSESLNRVVDQSGGDFQPAMSNLRQVAEKLNKTLDPKTQADMQIAVQRFSAASTRLDEVLANLQPVSKDLGANAATARPTTTVGQFFVRVNRIAADLNLLTRQLNDGHDRLNPSGSLQKLLIEADLYDQYRQMAADVRALVRQFSVFADKIAREPSVLTRGALRPN